MLAFFAFLDTLYSQLSFQCQFIGESKHSEKKNCFNPNLLRIHDAAAKDPPSFIKRKKTPKFLDLVYKSSMFREFQLIFN